MRMDPNPGKPRMDPNPGKVKPTRPTDGMKVMGSTPTPDVKPVKRSRPQPTDAWNGMPKDNPFLPMTSKGMK